MTTTLEGVSVEEVAQGLEAEAWHRADLSYLLLKGGQEIAYDHFAAWRKVNPEASGPAVLHCHRGFGKTALMGLMGLEECLGGSWRRARIAGPDLSEIHAALDETLFAFLARRPADVDVDAIQNGYRIHNPHTMGAGEFSTFSVIGLRELGNKKRGQRATWIGVDEVRNLSDAAYTIESVLRPMFARMRRRFMMLVSTSPDLGSHPFWEYAGESERRGCHVFIPFTENADFNTRSKDELESIFGPEGSVSWNREGLCKKAADSSQLAIPSFTAHKESIIVISKRPEFFYPYDFGDMGFIDAAAFLFCFIDHDRSKLVVEDEIVGPSIGTQALIQLIHAKELELWEKTPHYEQIRRWADATPRELDDLRLAGLYFQPARKGDEKWDKWAGLARLDSALACGRIEINPRCRSLCFQLENAIKNKWHDDLERELPKKNARPDSPIMGHQDALWALAYGVWQIRNAWLLQPYPTAEPAKHVYQAGKIEEKRKETARPLEGVTHRPLIITEHTGHIRGADPEGREKGQRKVLWK